jgi:eukaryotic-like serine/threonine-protein kinase
VTAAPERVAALFEALADLEEGEATRRLAQECAGELAVRRAVEELLAHDRAADGEFLAPIVERAFDELSVLGRLTVEAHEAPEGPPVRVSSRLGRYFVLSLLGEGGMGAVYLGYDDGLDRRVALKVLHQGTVARDWLVREGQALARLSHPNVVAIHEVGEQDGRVFLAMELVDGPTMSSWLEEARRSFTEILRLFMQAGRGLAAAHQAGLVHRDFKPSNVLVGKDGRARVVDFGIASLGARARDDRPPDTTGQASAPHPATAAPVTEKGALLGTPAFMAPEQFEGARATASSDQWSFGCALYRAVYGVPPYPPRESPPSKGPTPPPAREDVPAWLWPLLRRSLERNPADRFPSLEAVLQAIEEHVPRDPDLDPTLVVRERQVLSACFLAAFAMHGGLLMVPSTARILLGPGGVLGVAGASIALVIVVTLVRWRHLTRNTYGRRLAAVTLGVTLALLGHRWIGLRIGMTGAQILVEDAVLLAMFFGVIAQGEHRWLLWLMGIAIATATASSLRMDLAAPILGLGALAGFAAMSVRLFVDRRMTPKAAVGPLDPVDERSG